MTGDNVGNEVTSVFYARLKAAETASDAALQEYAQLLLDAQRASAQLDLTFGEPQSVFADINEAMAHHLRGRHHLARAHSKSLEIVERKGHSVTSWGDTVPTYDEARDAPAGTVVAIRSAA